MSLLPSLVVSISAYVAMRHGVFHVFNVISVHRGNTHSLVFILFASAVTVALTFFLSGASILSWVYGLALFVGGLIHLVLDELYSVDIAGVRLKKSFGTALKAIDMNTPLPGLAMLAGVIFMLPILPPLRDGGQLLMAFVAAFSTLS